MITIILFHQVEQHSLLVWQRCPSASHRIFGPHEFAQLFYVAPGLLKTTNENCNKITWKLLQIAIKLQSYKLRNSTMSSSSEHFCIDCSKGLDVLVSTPNLILSFTRNYIYLKVNFQHTFTCLCRNPSGPRQKSFWAWPVLKPKSNLTTRDVNRKP